jgi:hypothetical protein
MVEFGLGRQVNDKPSSVSPFLPLASAPHSLTESTLAKNVDAYIRSELDLGKGSWEWPSSCSDLFPLCTQFSLKISPCPFSTQYGGKNSYRLLIAIFSFVTPPQMKQADKDFRYMAISDLYNELQKDTFKVDLDGEKKLVARLLEAVARDKAAEVRSLAVKWCVLIWRGQ